MMDGGVEQWAEPAVDGSEEAKQVEMFLESEHAAMQKAFDDDLNNPSSKATPPPQVEVPSGCNFVIVTFDDYSFSVIGDLLVTENNRRQRVSTSFFSTHP